MHHIHKLKDHSNVTACKALDDLIDIRLLREENQTWVEKAVITRIWIGTSNSYAENVLEQLQELFRIFSQAEDALREREFGRPVDGSGLAAHVGFPGIAAGFAAAAGFLFAAERAADFGAAGPDIDIGDTAIAAAGAQERLGRDQVRRKHR